MSYSNLDSHHTTLSAKIINFQIFKYYLTRSLHFPDKVEYTWKQRVERTSIINNIITKVSSFYLWSDEFTSIIILSYHIIMCKIDVYTRAYHMAGGRGDQHRTCGKTNNVNFTVNSWCAFLRSAGCGIDNCFLYYYGYCCCRIISEAADTPLLQK